MRQLSTVLLAFLVTSCIAGVATAHDYKAGSLTIAHPWARPSLGQTGVSASYAEITNAGSEADRLVSATTDVARVVELHTHIQVGDVMQMRRLEEGIAIPAGETVRLAPGGLHIMLIDLARRIEVGERIKMTLVFEKAGAIEVEAVVEMKPSNSGGHGTHTGHGATSTGN